MDKGHRGLWRWTWVDAKAAQCKEELFIPNSSSHGRHWARNKLNYIEQNYRLQQMFLLMKRLEKKVEKNLGQEKHVPIFINIDSGFTGG